MNLSHINSNLMLTNSICSTDNSTVALFHFDKHAVDVHGIIPIQDVEYSFTDGKYNQAIEVINTSLTYQIDIIPPTTISFWLNPQVADNYSISTNWVLTPAPYSDTFLIWKRTTETYYRLRIEGSDVALPIGAISYNQWSYVIIVLSPIDTKLYINGILCGTLPVLTTVINQFNIGYSTCNNWFDELRVDSIARTDSEIMQWCLSSAPFHTSTNDEVVFDNVCS